MSETATESGESSTETGSATPPDTSGDTSTGATGESTKDDTDAQNWLADNTSTASSTGGNDDHSKGKGDTGDSASDTDPAITDLANLAKELKLTPAQIKGRLEASRKWEQRAKDNATAARENQSDKDRIKALEQALEDRDTKDAERDVREVEKSGRLAVTQLHAQLAQMGIKREDVQDVLDLVEPTHFLSDGEPDDKAIKKFAESLRKVAGRTTPDPDQGKRGGNSPKDMNAAIRAAVNGGVTRGGF